MIRILTATLALGFTAPAHAGGYLAGGVHGSTPIGAGVLSGMPSLKVGFGSRQFAGYGSLGFARGSLKAENRDFGIPDLNGFAAQPMLGVRPALGDASKPVVGILDAGVYTRIWGLGSNDRDIEPPEQDADASLRPVVGVVLGTGLDARLSENLSVSAEVGVDYFTAGYQFDGFVSHIDLISTWSAVYVNIWL